MRSRVTLGLTLLLLAPLALAAGAASGADPRGDEVVTVHPGNVPVGSACRDPRADLTWASLASDGVQMRWTLHVAGGGRLRCSTAIPALEVEYSHFMSVVLADGPMRSIDLELKEEGGSSTMCITAHPRLGGSATQCAPGQGLGSNGRFQVDMALSTFFGEDLRGSTAGAPYATSFAAHRWGGLAWATTQDEMQVAGSVKL